MKITETEINKLIHVEKKIKYLNEVIQLFNEKITDPKYLIKKSDNMGTSDLNTYLNHYHLMIILFKLLKV
jgi:hypothetical protein